MFKKLTTIIAAVMLTLSASSAFAALSFTDNELFRVVFDASGIQQISDLGTVSTLLSNGVSTITPGGISTQDASKLSVSYFAIDRTNSALWVGSTSKVPLATTAGFNGLASGSNDSIHLLLAQAVKGESSASLAPLANGTTTSVTQTLYYINDANTDGTPGIAKATIITSSDTTVITTPIPPAFLLMGSGLFGLFGFRRRVALSN